MRSKLAISAFVGAILVGSTLIASAQMQPAPGASSEGNVGPGATSGTKSKKHSGSSTMTTGSSMSKSKKGSAANPSSQGNVGPGTNNNIGAAPGGR
jgi:hypothetical protein